MGRPRRETTQHDHATVQTDYGGREFGSRDCRQGEAVVLLPTNSILLGSS